MQGIVCRWRGTVLHHCIWKRFYLTARHSRFYSEICQDICSVSAGRLQCFRMMKRGFQLVSGSYFTRILLHDERSPAAMSAALGIPARAPTWATEIEAAT